MSSVRTIFDETRRVHPSTSLVVTEIMLCLVIAVVFYCLGHHDGTASANKEAIEAGVAMEKDGKIVFLSPKKE